jgi:hypothetical protein
VKYAEYEKYTESPTAGPDSDLDLAVLVAGYAEPLAVIEAEIKALEADIVRLLGEVTA